MFRHRLQAFREAYHRFNNATMKAQAAARIAERSKEAEERAACELRETIQEVISRVRREEGVKE